ncbi:MAG TPA: glycosyltransferase family 39 protein [Thermoanaerobaculia bacterium]|nr:glycosyltransferase family 39 protein [Thermoanaerobaculia bacterium]
MAGPLSTGGWRRQDLLLLVLLGVVLFLPGLGWRDLWNPDEARYAEVAREMRLLGHWSVPHLNGQIYSQKPPLFFWSIAFCGRLTGGLDETAARLPSALSAIGALLLVYRIGERFFGRRAAWVAAAAFATCFKVLWQGRFGQIDMMLTALVALGVWFWVRGYTEGRPRLYPLFFVAAGLATLAKGPVGLLPPLLSILAFLAITRNRAELRRLRVGLGLLIWATVVLAWLVPAGISGGREYLEQIVFRQNVTRYVDPWHHFKNWHYYLTVIPAEFFPWSLLLPTAIVVGWKRLQEPKRRGFLFCLCWMAVTVLFFSVSPAKRSVYILTMYPAMALLVGAGLDRIAAEWPQWRRWLMVPLSLMAGLALLVMAALPVAGRGRPEAVPLGGDRFVWELTILFVPFLLGAVYAMWAGWSGQVSRAVTGIAAGMALTALGAALVALPRFDVFKSARGLSKVLVARMAPGEPYGIYPRLDSTFLFYTRRFCVNLDSEAKLRAFLARTGRVWLLAQRDDLARLKNLPAMTEVTRDQDPKEGYLLLLRP